MDKDQIKNQVEVAFSKLPYPGDHDLTVHPLGLDEQFYERIKNRNWRQLDSDLLNDHCDCIGVLTARGFQYYIAAFLLEDIENESSIADQLVWDFSHAVLEDTSPIIGVSGSDWFRERMETLSREQRSCLVSYFQYIRISELEDDQAAIDLVIEAINEI